MLESAHQGYLYQDILGAYLVANEISYGRLSTRFQFDKKKTSNGHTDKFDDIAIYREGKTSYIQVKYSNQLKSHSLSKSDFSSGGTYDLALFDLYETWKTLNKPGIDWRICLAWNEPIENDKIREVLFVDNSIENTIPGTKCYKFSIGELWPQDEGVLSSWKALKEKSKSIDRNSFSQFLDSLIVELNFPKSSLLKSFSDGLENLLKTIIERIGIGIYPNDHLTVKSVAESLSTITRRSRATSDYSYLSCSDIAKEIGIIQDFGGIEQKFPIDPNLIVSTPNRIDQVVEALTHHRSVILTAEPGAGKSWFIENLMEHLSDDTLVIKHYCYIALGDALSHKRITRNVLFGSLIQQIINSDPSLGSKMTKRYASNLEQLNILLDSINKSTLLIVDGIDHIWRVYQKNRGGLTEDQTSILKSLSQLNRNNQYVSYLIISQPIKELAELDGYYRCELESIDEEFVANLLAKNAIPNIKDEKITLSSQILKKSNGNALYCKYIIDHLKSQTSFDSIKTLPSYDFNLTSYYGYLFEQIQENISIPSVLCGADFSLTESEIKEITFLGDLVSRQLDSLSPIMKIGASGYSIYHESFKRFIIDIIRAKGISVDQIVYKPLTNWLEKKPFYESTKAYGHLLKLYYELGDFSKISESISEDFIEKSIYYAQPFDVIHNNHRLQRKSLETDGSLAKMIIVIEQAKVVFELDYADGSTLVNYLKAVREIHGEEVMDRVLWDGENLQVDAKTVLRLFVEQAYKGAKIIHWSIFPKGTSISTDIVGLYAIKLLHSEEYDRFDELIKKVNKNSKEALRIINDELEWWSIFKGHDWLKFTPYYLKLSNKKPVYTSGLIEAIEYIFQSKHFVYDENWKDVVNEIIHYAKDSGEETIDSAIHLLSGRNWFYNWLIYLIKIANLSKGNYSAQDLIESFSFLVRDTDPFKGEPRACDLYRQLPTIKKSFHRGLLMANGDQQTLKNCMELLEKVTYLTTSMRNSFSGPLTDEEYLELISIYSPGEFMLQKFDEYYKPLSSRRVYWDVAEVAFDYARVLSIAGKENDAVEKYSEGVQALAAYGFRKDRTLSEVLTCSAPFQESYGSLNTEWFYDLYQMAMTVVTHTDGKSTSSYPIEWFEEFLKVFPDEALKFLACETIENDEATWHQESQFLNVLEDGKDLFNGTQWYLLARTLPLAASDHILDNALSLYEDVDFSLKKSMFGWVKSIPTVISGQEYSSETIKKYNYLFDTSLKSNSKKSESSDKGDEVTLLPTSSEDDVLGFLETSALSNHHSEEFRDFILSINDMAKRKEILREAARGFRYGDRLGEWVNEIFEEKTDEWIYFNICLFVFTTDGWYHGLYNLEFLKRVHDVDPEKSLITLKEILGLALSEGAGGYLITGNLITALSRLKVDESIVTELLQLAHRIVKRRLPNPSKYQPSESLRDGMSGMTREEIMVALLIARFKTLSTEKNQSIIWALTFIAKKNPQLLFEAYYWAFSNSELLLPIHRSVLLQILVENVDRDLVPDLLLSKLVDQYPTGFFLEDQFIRLLLNYGIELDEKSEKGISLKPHKYDKGFFPYMHMKYRYLEKHFGILEGSYESYKYRRNQISKQHSQYYIRTEEILTTIVPNANAAYEIVNTLWYGFLKELTLVFGDSYRCSLDFFLDEITLQIGSKSIRPEQLPLPSEFPSNEIQTTILKNDNWVILASREKELSGKQFKKKEVIISSRTISTSDIETDEYAKYLFRVEQYKDQVIQTAPKDRPICMLNIIDTLESMEMLFVSPWIIRELDLKIDSNLNDGLVAYNEDGEIVIKLVSWTEEYYGSISDGTEVPKKRGIAVLLRDDYMDSFLKIIDGENRYVLRSERSVI